MEAARGGIQGVGEKVANGVSRDSGILPRMPTPNVQNCTKNNPPPARPHSISFLLKRHPPGRKGLTPDFTLRR